MWSYLSRSRRSVVSVITTRVRYYLKTAETMGGGGLSRVRTTEVASLVRSITAVREFSVDTGGRNDLPVSVWIGSTVTGKGLLPSV